MEIIRKHRPSNFVSLKKALTQEDIRVNNSKLLTMIAQLQLEGVKLSFKPQGSFRSYLADILSSWWFYLVIIITLSEFFFVTSNIQAGIFLFLRIVFGLAVLGIIPGFLTLLVVFPRSGINILERIALGIFLSFLISISIGVVLGVGLFFQATNNIIFLTVYVIVVDVAAIFRSYNFLRTSS